MPFKVTRIQQNGVDQPTAGLYCVIRPKRDQPYFQLLYKSKEGKHKTIYLQGNVKITTEEKAGCEVGTIFK